MSCAILPHTRRSLKTCGVILWNNARFYSGESKFGKSNANFPSFSTKEKFQDFQKTPNPGTIASIILYGTSLPPNAKMFAERMPASSLIEGSLHAVESVTQTISELSVSIVSGIPFCELFVSILLKEKSKSYIYNAI